MTGVNNEMSSLAPQESMQFDNVLDRISVRLYWPTPSLGPVKLMQVDLSDGFYYINLNTYDIPKLGVIFPTKPGQETIIAFPLSCPWDEKTAHQFFTPLLKPLPTL